MNLGRIGERKCRRGTREGFAKSHGKVLQRGDVFEGEGFGFIDVRFDFVEEVGVGGLGVTLRRRTTELWQQLGDSHRWRIAGKEGRGDEMAGVRAKNFKIAII